MRYVVLVLAALLVVVAVAVAQDPVEPPEPAPTSPTAIATPELIPAPDAAVDQSIPPDFAGVVWHDSKALGQPARKGRLKDGVQLPELGEDFFTWDPIYNRIPNREWRRWGTDRLVRIVLRVAHDFRAAHPRAARMAVGDLSRPHGGDFGPRFGYIGHASHQNGLDVDVYYPRLDGLERAA